MATRKQLAQQRVFFDLMMPSVGLERMALETCASPEEREQVKRDFAQQRAATPSPGEKNDG